MLPPARHSSSLLPTSSLWRRQRHDLRIDALVKQRRAFLGHCAKHLIGRVAEKLNAVPSELVRDRVKRNSRATEIAQYALRVLDILFETVAHPAVLTEGIQRRGRHGIDCVGPDQLFDIEDVAVGIVLRTGAGPEQALLFRAVCRKFLPALAGK